MMQVQMGGLQMISIDAVIFKDGLLLSFRQLITLSSVGSLHQIGELVLIINNLLSILVLVLHPDIIPLNRSYSV
jgi:hypothetical protein